MNIIHIVGARPNFMKAAPVMAAITDTGKFSQILVHTGQHYDENMSDIFFRQLGLPKPDVNLEVGSGSHAVQTAQIMIRLEEYFLKNRPDFVLVYGDVNSTAAASLVCAKLTIPVGHVEAGLRSYDRTMPEEINRLVTDQLASLLFTPSKDGNENLKKEGIVPEKIHLVGNVMIDTLIRLLPRAERKWDELAIRFDITDNAYGLVTLHRPSNVDEPEMLEQIVSTLLDIGRQIPLLFPVHPRTRQRMHSFGLDLNEQTNLRLIDPIGYMEFLALQQHARLVITDSGGIQEETTFLGIPCLTLRENTERPVTVTTGTNMLVGQDMQQLRTRVESILTGQWKEGRIPELWDGKASERIAQILLDQPLESVTTLQKSR